VSDWTVVVLVLIASGLVTWITSWLVGGAL
jgi:hypothetical protein